MDNPIIQFLEQHPALLAIGVFLVAFFLLSALKKQPQLQGPQPAVDPGVSTLATTPYIAGSNSYSTTYETQGANSPIIQPAPVSSQPVPQPGQPIPQPIRVNPVKISHKGGRVWDQHHVMQKGETLPSVASYVTSYMRRYQGMPSTVLVTAGDLQTHNGNRTQFKIGESIITPRWDKNLN